MTGFTELNPSNIPGCADCSGNIVTQCQLLNGDIRLYHISSETNRIHTPLLFEYLGAGVVYSLNGNVRKSNVRKHFWKRKT